MTIIRDVDEHSLISALKRLYEELGTTPTRTQFITHVGKGSYKFEKYWPDWATFVNAAGLVPVQDNRKISNKVFERPIASHMEAYKPRGETQREPWPTMAIISDIHWPFHSERVLTRFKEYVATIKPEYVILNGDAWDMYSHSKFPRSHNIFTPKDEQDLSRKENERFWGDIIASSPNSRCYQMLGNHDVRPMKRILESYPEAEDWIKEKLTSLFTFGGVTTMMDSREELLLPGNICVFHGYLSKLGGHRDYTLMNCINGHTHKGGAVFRHIHGQTLWELNSGLAGDPEGKGLTYTPQRIMIWTPGFGAVDSLGPRFIPC